MMAVPLSSWARQYLSANDAAFLETADKCICIQQVGEDAFVCWLITREPRDAVTAKMVASDLSAIDAVRFGFEQASGWRHPQGAR